MSSLDDILERIARARSQREVGDMLALVAMDAGYENLSLVRMQGGRMVAFPWAILPAGFLETYLNESWMRIDPVVRYSARSRVPFDWTELPGAARMTAAQVQVMENKRALGVHSGFSVPVHGLGQDCDVVHFSVRQSRQTPDPSRRRMLATIAVQAVTRFLELGVALKSTRRPADRREIFLRRTQLDGIFSGKGHTPFQLPLGHLHALVLVEAGARRWRMGLTELGGRIYPQRPNGPLADLLGWGLIADVPDDTRFRYHLAPTPLGAACLARREEVPALRCAVWHEEVSRDEVPDDFERNGLV